MSDKYQAFQEILQIVATLDLLAGRIANTMEAVGDAQDVKEILDTAAHIQDLWEKERHAAGCDCVVCLATRYMHNTVPFISASLVHALCHAQACQQLVDDRLDAILDTLPRQ
jgi:hypothetical protein